MYIFDGYFRMLHRKVVMAEIPEPLDAKTDQIRCGGQLVPFTNAFPQNTDLYRLMSTRPGEMLN